MLVRVTDRCNMMCRHCMLDGVSTTGKHMEMSVFSKTQYFIDRCNSSFVILSGGEPTLHPHILNMVDRMLEVPSVLGVVLASNGTFLRNKNFTRKLQERKVQKGARLHIQITNDPRYYPKSIPEVPNEFLLETQINSMFPCKRQRENNIEINRESPGCFNLRSATRSLGFPFSVHFLESKGKCCQPSVNIDGSVRTGETDWCYKLGTVESSVSEIGKTLENMQCGKCGLNHRLTPLELSAIGEPVDL